MVWYSRLFQNFPQFIVIHTVKGFGIVNKAEIHVFLELSCFSHDPADVGNLISGSSTFSKTSLDIWKFMVQVLLKPGSGAGRLRQGTGARRRDGADGQIVGLWFSGRLWVPSHFPGPGSALGASTAFPVAFWPLLLVSPPKLPALLLHQGTPVLAWRAGK